MGRCQKALRVFRFDAAASVFVDIFALTARHRPRLPETLRLSLPSSLITAVPSIRGMPPRGPE